MVEKRFPPGWDERRVKEFLAELDAMTEEEWIVADESLTIDGEDQVEITVPTALLPEIRHLLARHEASKRPS